MKKIAILVTIILSILPIFTKAEEKITKEDVLLSILNSLGGEYLEEDISINGVILDRYLDDKNEFEIIGNDIANSLVDKSTREAISDEGYMQLNYYGLDRFKNPVTIILSTYENLEQGVGQTFLYINLNKKEHFLQKDDIIYKVESIYNKYNQPFESTVCVLGMLEGKFHEKETKDNIFDAIHRLNGRIVDEYKDDYLISYTAYTDKIKKSILAGDEKINLNIALRYSEYDNKTIIWVGTPIITSGY